jgi:uncharacterized lipoprotein YmbA
MMRAIAVAACASLALAGCAVSIPPETFYALGAAIEPAAGQPSRANAASIAVVVETARLPLLIDRPQLVVSIGDAQVVPLEQQRWAEPLSAQIPRVVALDLSRALPEARVSTSDDVVDGAAQGFRLALDVQRFESRPGDGIALEVAWTLRRTSGEIVASGRERLREAAPGAGYEPLVRAHNRALATVSRTIAAALRSAAS